jgi:hypothetical protein
MICIYTSQNHLASIGKCLSRIKVTASHHLVRWAPQNLQPKTSATAPKEKISAVEVVIFQK